MKGFALALFATLAPALGQHAHGKTFVNDPSHIARLNSNPESTWTAAPSDFFDGLTFDDARVFLGTDLLHISDYANQSLDESFYAAVSEKALPASFDATAQWSGLIHAINNQQACGSCWAFSATEVLSDRVAIATKKASPELSPEDLVSCDTGDMGCSGGRLPAAWSYLQTTGVVSDACFPYAAGDGQAPACANHCANSETWDKSKVKASRAYPINGVINMQKEIMTNGPIQVAFKVYKSFMSYKTGVYQKHSYEFLPEGGHAVKMVGWGVDSGVDFWKIANSWGVSWGEEGFFRFLRGKDHCGMETMGPPYAGIPAISTDLVV